MRRVCRIAASTQEPAKVFQIKLSRALMCDKEFAQSFCGSGNCGLHGAELFGNDRRQRAVDRLEVRRRPSATTVGAEVPRPTVAVQVQPDRVACPEPKLESDRVCAAGDQTDQCQESKILLADIVGAQVLDQAPCSQPKVIGQQLISVM